MFEDDSFCLTYCENPRDVQFIFEEQKQHISLQYVWDRGVSFVH